MSRIKIFVEIFLQTVEIHKLNTQKDLALYGIVEILEPLNVRILTFVGLFSEEMYITSTGSELLLHVVLP